MTNYNKNKDTGFAYPKRSLFGRRQGRALTEQRQDALNNVLPKINISKEKLKSDQTSNPADFFDKEYKKYWLEIGFGYGEHMKGLMLRDKTTGYIGAEPFINGMSNFLSDIKDEDLSNIRVIMDDGMIIARSVTPRSLDGIYILNPDPWHKKRHHKRRIINQENLDIFAKILKSGSQLIMTTDVPYLAEWMLTQTSNHPNFEWKAKSKHDWQEKPDNWITTRYETKGAKGAKKMVYLFFERK